MFSKNPWSVRAMRDEQSVLDHITLEEITRVLRKLVGINSANPPGDCREMCKACAEEFDEVRIPFLSLAVKEEAPSLIGRVDGENPSPSLLFNAHMDTVPIGDISRWNHHPLGADIVEGRLYGRGAGDDKASVVAQIVAAKAIKRAGVRLKGKLLISPVADEEAGGFAGTKWLKDSGYLLPDWVVIGEQTNNRVAICERIACRMLLTVYGKAAHGAQPWDGENAIVNMAKAILAFHERLVPALNMKTHRYLPPPSLNIGTIQGGTKVNMVPEYCTITIDRRMHPGETAETAETELKEVLDTVSPNLPFEYDLRVEDFGTKSVFTDPNHKLIKTMQDVLKRVTGEERPLKGYTQGSDGRHFAQDGIPVAIFGPSDPSVGHASDEFVSLGQVLEAAQVFALTALEMLGKRDE